MDRNFSENVDQNVFFRSWDSTHEEKFIEIFRSVVEKSLILFLHMTANLKFVVIKKYEKIRPEIWPKCAHIRNSINTAKRNWAVKNWTSFKMSLHWARRPPNAYILKRTTSFFLTHHLIFYKICKKVTIDISCNLINM